MQSENGNFLKMLSSKTAEKCTFYLYDSLPSTNLEAKRCAENGAAEFSIVLANTQTSGKGTCGRGFFSPAGTGVYLSIVLYPNTKPENSLYITVAAAVAVSRAIKSVFGMETGIKWVNDIYFNNKKVCGILAESTLDECGKIKHCVLGIGVNLAMPEGGFPHDLEIAGALLNKAPSEETKAAFIAETVNEFIDIYKNPQSTDYAAEYKSRSVLTGKKIKYKAGGSEFCGTVLEINEKFELVLKLNGGEIKNISYGEAEILKQ